MLSSYIQGSVLKVLMFFFPVLKKKKVEINKTLKRSTTNDKISFNISYAFAGVFLITVCVVSFFVILISNMLSISSVKYIYYFHFLIICISLILNYFFIWKNNLYLKYFSEFKEMKYSVATYIYVNLFFIGAILLPFTWLFW